MTPFLRTSLCFRLASALALMLCVSVLWAADYTKPSKGGAYNPSNETIEMFAAMTKGDIAVKLIPRDSKLCHILIENKTDKPLNVKLPSSFGAVPVLAQRDEFGGGERGGRGGGGGGGQSMGGGMGGMGGMGMGGMGMFNVAAEKVGKFDVTTVCLEHGKAEPTAKMPYEIRPIEDVTTKPGVRELCESLGTGQIDQRAAQAAAWHLNNDMTWEQLATKAIRHINGVTEPYFTREQLRSAMRAATIAVRIAQERKKQEGTAESPGDAVNNVQSPSSGS